jgi:GGDEF domain-containing protein
MFATMQQHAPCLRDDASGLSGPAIFADRLLHARQRGGCHSDPFVVAFMDLALTGAADTTRQMQHAEVAQQLADRLQQPLRSGDTVAALGPL